MTKTEEFREKNRELQQVISEEIHKAENGIIKRNIFQLKTILKELQIVERKRGAVLSYPHIIVDSWDYGDPLGKRLMELASVYEKIKNKE